MEFRQFYSNPHKYLFQVSEGEEITLEVGGKPMARLVPLPPPIPKRAPRQSPKLESDKREDVSGPDEDD